MTVAEAAAQLTEAMAERDRVERLNNNEFLEQ